MHTLTRQGHISNLVFYRFSVKPLEKRKLILEKQKKNVMLPRNNLIPVVTNC